LLYRDRDPYRQLSYIRRADMGILEKAILLFFNLPGELEVSTDTLIKPGAGALVATEKKSSKRKKYLLASKPQRVLFRANCSLSCPPYLCQGELEVTTETPIEPRAAALVVEEKKSDEPNEYFLPSKPQRVLLRANGSLLVHLISAKANCSLLVCCFLPGRIGSYHRDANQARSGRLGGEREEVGRAGGAAQVYPGEDADDLSHAGA
jgi:hypothetical protein